MPLTEARNQIQDGIAAVLSHAQAASVKLAVEPLHPMYTGDRYAVNTLKQANDMAATLAHPMLGVTVDVYHVWWDPDLEREIRRAGRTIFSFHVCDWRTLTRDLLNDRALMGEGCIDIRQIRGWVEAAGFNGFIEVEIFSNEHWSRDQAEYLESIKASYLKHA
jgi:sugar phosphate isomerase/epimerase